MKLGLAYKDITPNEPAPLLGYGDRTHNSEGVHDPIYVYAWHVDSAVWLIFDLCLFSAATTTMLTEKIAKRLEKSGVVSTDQIIIQTTHTHSAPDVSLLAGNEEPRAKRYTDLLVDQAAAAAEEAYTTRFEGYIEAALGENRIAVNRRDKKRAIDPRVVLFRLKDESGGLEGMLFHYSCHLTSQGVENYLISADWVGSVRSHFQAELKVPAAFIQGAEGNTDPYTRGELDMADPDQAKGVSFDTMEKISRSMIESLEKAMEREPAAVLKTLTLSKHSIALPLRFGAMTEEDIREKIDSWKSQFAEFMHCSPNDIPEDQSINALVKEYARKNNISKEETEKQVASQFTYTQFLYLYKYGLIPIDKTNGTITVEYTLADFTDLTILGVPAEVLLENAFDFQGRFPERIALVSSLVGGDFGYMPHETNFQEQRADILYETISTLFTNQGSILLLSDAESVLKAQT